MSDLLPAVPGLFLGSDEKPWDGSKLINIIKKAYFQGPILYDTANFPPVWCFLNGQWMDSVEGDTNTPMVSGKFTVFKLHLFFNNLTQDATFTLRKNGANTSMTITIPAGQTGFFTSTSSVSILTNDLCNIQIDTPYDLAGLQLKGSWLLEFQPD